MTIEFNLEPKDMKAFRVYHQKHDSTSRMIFYIPLFVFGVLCIFNSLKYIENIPRFIFHFVTQFVLYLIIFKGFMFIISKFADWRLLKSKNQRGVLCKHTITINEDALIEATAFNETKHFWSGVFKVDENKDYIYIYITVNGAHIIPKRSFASQEDAGNFFKQAKIFYLDAKFGIKQNA